jgi:outer membrane receptor for ferrienterochelin and colicins
MQPKKNILFTIILCLLSISQLFAQNLKGTIKELDPHKDQIPLPGANMRWLGTTIGAISDINGNFSLQKQQKGTQKLIVSFIGYKTDTIVIPENQNEIKILLASANDLKELVINGNLEGTYISKMRPINTQVITGAGLLKAACCNLSESFQNSATVDVNYSDAVTGAKQIQMLGLSGVYSQILTENIPSVRGLATTYGLGYIPGSWMESIQISKGTASVINGYESTTGQINVEYKKPETSKENVFVNLYGSDMGKAEANFNVSAKLGKNTSTMLLAHAEQQFSEIDHNHDMFLDIPMLKQYNIMNRWNYDIPGKLHSITTLSVLSEDRTAGQFMQPNPSDTIAPYKIGIKTNRYQFSTKNGFFSKKEGRSFGTIISGTYHDQNSYFGKNTYSGLEKSLYVNLIYADIIGNTNHKINTGLSYMLDNYSEKYNDSAFAKTESLPGAFVQYTYSYLNIFTAIAGFRADYNSLYGPMYTPRLHFKYTVNENTSFRGTFGKGYRITNIFPENSSLLASSRKLVITEKLLPEEAWNYGLNITRTMKVSKKDANFSIDYYRTNFKNQVIVDMDKSSDRVYFYNLKGSSYSNSLQAEFSGQLFKRFEVTAALRFNDVKMTINDSLVEKPFVSKYKGILSLSYSTNLNKWKFDATLHYNGKSRIPDTRMNPEKYRLPDESPDYFVLYAQVTKKYKNWDFYVGAENITDYTQKKPIIAADDPYGSHFDTSMIWGPITGRMFYAGIRYKLSEL